jgi:hypothetical protein
MRRRTRISRSIAETLIWKVLDAQPANRTAFLRSAQIAHGRMVLAQARRRDVEVLPLARRAEEWLLKYLATGEVDEVEKAQVVIVGSNVANWYVRKDLLDDGLACFAVRSRSPKERQPRQAAPPR